MRLSFTSTATLCALLLSGCILEPPVVVAPPPPPVVVHTYRPGYVVRTLQPGYTVHRYRGSSYYYRDNVYYRRVPRRGYMVVERPY